MKTQSKRVLRRAAPRRQQQAIVRREPPSIAEAIEKVLIQGDLAGLSPEQRLEYYKAVCKSLGLNQLTNPFAYIVFKDEYGSAGRMTLYALKSCTEQLRQIHKISVTKSSRQIADGYCTTDVEVTNGTGRTDTGTGMTALTKYKDGKTLDLTGKEYANAIMRSETKAKRRATLSICGLAFLDESELDTLDNYAMVSPGGRVIYEKALTGTTDAAAEVAQRKIAEHKAKELPEAKQTTPTPAEAEIASQTATVSEKHAPSASTKSVRTPKEPKAGTEVKATEQKAQGIVTAVYTTKQDKSPLVTPSGGPYLMFSVGGKSYTLFDNKDMAIARGTQKLFDIMELAQDQHCEFYFVEKLNAKNPKSPYRNATRFTKIASLEWDEDGTSVLRRESAMPATEQTPIEWPKS